MDLRLIPQGVRCACAGAISLRQPQDFTGKRCKLGRQLVQRIRVMVGEMQLQKVAVAFDARIACDHG